MDAVKILVVGSGGIGGFYGGKLTQAGAEVSMLCRSDYEVIKDKGVEVHSIWGDFKYRPCKIFSTEEQPSPEGFDYVLICTKVLPSIDISGLIRPYVMDHTAIVLIQNGIDIEIPVRDAFPLNEIISGLAFTCCHRSEPGVIHHTDYGRLVLGVYPEGKSDKTEKLVEMFKRSGVPCVVSENIVKSRWEKLVWNAPFNPISVLSGGWDTEVLLASMVMETVVKAVMEEVVTLARADGYDLSYDVVGENLQATKVMKPYKTSMLLDYEAAKPLEVEAILGNAVRKAVHRGVPVPNLRMLYALLLMIDRKNRERRGN